MTAEWITNRGATNRRGDATAVRESVQPRGRPRDGGGDRVSRYYGLKGRRSGDARVDATARRTTGRRRCGPTGRRSGSPMLDRWRGALNSGTIFTGPAEARVTDGPGRSRGVDEADRGGERMIKPIARDIRDAARWRSGGGGVRDEAGDDGRRETSCGRICQHRHLSCQSNAGARAARPERPTEQRRPS